MASLACRSSGSIISRASCHVPLTLDTPNSFSSGGEPDIGSIRFFAELFARKAISANDVEYLLYPLVIAATIIFMGYKIAPRYKLKTAITLFVVYVVIWAIGVVVAIGGLFNASFSGRMLLALLGAGVGLYGAKESDKKNNDLP